MANYRQHRDGHMVLAIGWEHSPADLVGRGFLPTSFLFNPDCSKAVATYQRARVLAEAFDRAQNSRK